MFPDKNSLEEVGFWGGEPTIRLDRAFYTLNKLIDYYPNLSTINFSTNFTTKNWFEQIGNLCKLLSNFENRKFRLEIQLSIDGPEDINDLGRGPGTTKLFIEHWK